MSSDGKRNRGQNWESAEVSKLIQLRLEMDDCFKSSKFPDVVWSKLANAGDFKRTVGQLQAKWKNIKCDYVKERTYRKNSGENGDSCDSSRKVYMDENLYDMLQAFMESDPLVNLQMARILSSTDLSRRRSESESSNSNDSTSTPNKPQRRDSVVAGTLKRLAMATESMADSMKQIADVYRQ